MEPKYDGEAVYIDSNIVVYRSSNGKFGVIDIRNSKIRIPDKYDEVNCMFSDSLIEFKYKGKYGFVDKKTGKELVAPKYDYVVNSDYFENLVRVIINNKCGLINKITGKEILPVKYDYDSFTSGYYYGNGDILIEIKLNNKIGLVNRNRVVVVKPIYDEIKGIGEGIVTVGINGLYGFVDARNGKIAIKPQYNYAGIFSEGLAPVVEGIW
ncbi:WG repeat protein [Caldicellulosiruptor bescii]|uniref:KWG Leptospira repeat protein n=3 Tax=Caldicellulosiruptor bescii TaxID=31899 RepID=B9MQ43_CALBD|nr:WG repeat-containing protein [Caldicellulosiruptor bescii]ACM59835.1 KWG Leptospira repeat protein [Caldicellulosiruptor bescii DSM 6725]PBC87247.1 WG repeat protein [Caldicellulosiruptor bescii]PBC90186.1 WG repeat protein [Caldicellulosiruptor bescii]PBD04385.1 WG repeat protein [Caldicellulosiruptor bescii]PBD05983.1 WG repeat protein [Caldicellulosiruptor bescii]